MITELHLFDMQHSILFTGHMIDGKDREHARFPVSKELPVRAAIYKKLVEEQETVKTKLSGIAGGACGGDILFHEVCEELNIPTEIYLALPVEEFKKHSVSFAGPVWEDRFDRLTQKLPVHILPKKRSMNKENNIWAQTNLWMLEEARAIGGRHITLMALWDGKGGDGIGGTEHMINVAKDDGARIITIDINALIW